MAPIDSFIRLRDRSANDRNTLFGLGSERRRRHWLFLGVGILLALVMLRSVWTVRQTILSSIAHWWSVSDQLEPSDAVAVLGGRGGTRVNAAALLYRQGLVRKIVVSSAGFEANRDTLIEPGVPAQKSNGSWRRIPAAFLSSATSVRILALSARDARVCFGRMEPLPQRVIARLDPAMRQLNLFGAVQPRRGEYICWADKGEGDLEAS
jgi:pimeloyl-ACP methyl ester carboxylesterase